ncbi:MAG: hypothetical protein M1442_01910 [Candidatus Thermoplasmatota archaeon]|nr:hypothetical protein [Candidatus Thermoplasmatota archaeon]
MKIDSLSAKPCDSKQIYLGDWQDILLLDRAGRLEQREHAAERGMALPECHGRTEKDSIALTKLRKIGYF